MVKLVNPITVAIVGIGFAVLLGVGAFSKTKAFAQSVFSPAPAPSKSASEQLNVEIGGGEVKAEAAKTAESLQTSVIDAPAGGVVVRRGQNIVSTPQATIFDRPEGVLVKGSAVAQIAGIRGQQFVGVLSEKERNLIREKEFTEQERADIAALEARRQKAITERGIDPNIKLSGVELVLRKREQEELSKAFIKSRFGGQSFVNGKLFANPNFVQ